MFINCQMNSGHRHWGWYNYFNAKCPLMFANFNPLSKRLYLRGHFITWQSEGTTRGTMPFINARCYCKELLTSHPFTSKAKIMSLSFVEIVFDLPHVDMPPADAPPAEPPAPLAGQGRRRSQRLRRHSARLLDALLRSIGLEPATFL